MDIGLLTEGSSNGGSGGVKATTTSSSSSQNNNNQRAQPPKYGRRSNVIAYGSSYQKAAALVDLVRLSHPLSLNIPHMSGHFFTLFF